MKTFIYTSLKYRKTDTHITSNIYTIENDAPVCVCTVIAPLNAFIPDLITKKLIETKAIDCPFIPTILTRDGYYFFFIDSTEIRFYHLS